MAGLLAVLDDPATGVAEGSARHAWVEVDLRAAVPVAVPLVVTATLTARGRLGAGTGLGIDVDVEGPDGPLVRSRHVVAATTDPPPAARLALPRPPAAVGEATAPPPDPVRLLLDGARVGAYRAGAADTSPAHDDGPGAIVPGLMVLWAAVARTGVAPAPPLRLGGRFAHPLAVDVAAGVRVGPDGAGGHRLEVTADGRTVVRHGHVGPLGGPDLRGGHR